jgi:predicted ATP-binding protein involved in virulence
MHITQFRMTNIGRFKLLEVPLWSAENPSHVRVFVGNNGSGKTSMLKSLATALSWYVARLRSESGMGNPIPEQVIKNGSSYAAIELAVSEGFGQEHNPDADPEKALYHWTLVKSKTGKKTEKSTHLTGATELAKAYRLALTHDEQTALPLVAFYPVERVVLDIPLKIKEKHSFSQVDGYDNSLTQGVDFRRFFEWFREREDAENEQGIPDSVFEQLALLSSKDNQLWQELKKLQASSRDRQLTAVRSAIQTFMPEFSHLRVKRKPCLHMAIDKAGETLNVAQLSQGEKSLMALVGDIARRLAMMNPALENPLQGSGIVLIDEVDMHLHPTWQKSIVQRLRHTFPNVQFILTTHSSLVLSQLQTGEAYRIGCDAKGMGCLEPIENPNKAALVDMLKDVFDVDLNAMKRAQMSGIEQKQAKADLLALIREVSAA